LRIYLDLRPSIQLIHPHELTIHLRLFTSTKMAKATKITMATAILRIVIVSVGNEK